MKNKEWDVAIVGAGAAGLMAAVTARREGLEVLLLDGKEKIGAKILMSGGTRCNVTNYRVTEKDFESESPQHVRKILAAFSSEKAAAFFEELGVSLVLEDQGKYFPSTHSGRTVLEAFLKEVSRNGIHLESGRKIQSLKLNGNIFEIEASGFLARAKTVILASGGLSFPATGSDGSGYSIAKSFGHTLIETTPSLTPLATDDPDWKSLSGLSLPVRLTLSAAQKKKAVFEGSFLFTHSGFSGPVVLNISRHWIRETSKDAKLLACFLPSETEESLRAALMAAAGKRPQEKLKKFLSMQLPERFSEVILKKAGISDNVVLNQLKRTERETLIKTLLASPLAVSGNLGYAKAEVTAGGIKLEEVDSKTLESKLTPGLFFAGEILDVDGRIGGFNFQWAWSSAVVAAKGAAKKIRELQ